MKIVYLREALKDLQWLRRYYDSIFPAGGGNARESLKAAERTILNYPYIGQPCGEAEIAREYRISRTPFLLLYRIIDDRIEILRVIDSRSDWMLSKSNSD